MDISTHYVIYKTKSIMDNSNYLALEEIVFDDWIANAFDTEEDAIAKLIENKMSYQDYLILKRVFLRS